MDDIKELSSRDEKVASVSESSLKLDKSGLPLIPQPTNSPIDPLNYPNVCIIVISLDPVFNVRGISVSYNAFLVAEVHNPRSSFIPGIFVHHECRHRQSSSHSPRR